MQRWAIDIDRDDITRATLMDVPEPALAPGEIEVVLELFAVTANNVTYAALGAQPGLLAPDKGYWDFFANPDAPGRLPVWGFARATRSRVDGIVAGDAFYGYWPMASHAVLAPTRVGRVGFLDSMPRRQGLPEFYNRYQRVEALEDYAEADRGWWPVYRPLYLTGWLVADQIAEEAPSARRVIATAASSKTAMGFAHAMRERADRPELVALTSARSAAFLAGTGLYDRVVHYDEIANLDAEMPAAVVDFAGDPGVSAALRDRLGPALVTALGIGKTHWDAAGAPARQPFFFAPDRIAKRIADWGGDAFRARAGDGWRRFMADVGRFTTLDRRAGGPAALAAWEDAVTGNADPRAGVVIAP